MYKPKGFYKANDFSSANKNISKILLVFAFILDFVFGINFGFVKYLDKKYQPLVKCTTLITSFIITLIFCAPLLVQRENEMDVFWYSFGLVQYIVYFLILNFTQYKFYDLIQDLNLIDKDVPDLNRVLFYIFILFYSFLSFGLQFIFGFLQCKETGKGKGWCKSDYYIPYPIYAISILSLDVISVLFLFIYYFIYCYVYKLKTIVKSNRMNYKQIQKYYSNVAECYDKATPLYDRMITAELMFEVPRLMNTVFNMLYFIQTKEKWIMFMAEGVFSFPIIIHIIVPAIAVEMLNSEVENLKRTLNKNLLVEEDEKKSKEIRKLLQYMEAHRLDHKVWRFIPINSKLPLSILSGCISYLIVIIQFTHLYDE